MSPAADRPAAPEPRLTRRDALTALAIFLSTPAIIFGRQILLTLPEVARAGYGFPLPDRIFLWPALAQPLAVLVVNVFLCAVMTAVAAWAIPRRGYRLAAHQLLNVYFCVYLLVTRHIFFERASGPIVRRCLLGLIVAAVALRLLLPRKFLAGLVRVINSRVVRLPALAVGIGLGCVVGGYVAFQALVAAPPPRCPDPRRPDIVYLLVDSLRSDVTVQQADGKPLMPNLARLANLGVRFTQACASSYWTGIALPCLFTGHLPAFFGDHQAFVRSPDVPTFVQRAFEAGYDTRALVATPLVRAYNLQRYFLHFEYTTNDQLVRLAIDHLRQPRERPSLIYIHLMTCHYPYQPPPRFRAPSRTDLDPQEVFNGLEKSHGADDVLLQETRELYEGAARQLDEDLGRLADFLNENGRKSRTMVILTADHGDGFMEHGLLFHEEAAFYQEIMHIPLVVAYAPGVTQGANIDRLISNRQAFHLVVDAAEGRLPPEKFFARLNELTADEALADDGVDNIGFIRDGRKLIRFRNHEFLFDLRADPAERVNLIAQQADLVRQLKARIAALNAEQRRQFREFVRREGPAMDALSRRQLKELGYIVP